MVITPPFPDIMTGMLFWLACGSVIASIAFLVVSLRNGWHRQGGSRACEPSEQRDDHQLLRATIYAIIMLAFSLLCFCVTLVLEIYKRTTNWFFSGFYDIAMSTDIVSWINFIVMAMLCTGWIALTRSIRAAKSMPKLITPGNIMQNETRRRIVALIEQFPGIHFSRIKAAIGASPRTIRDQVRTLLSFGNIRAVEIDGRIAYFSSDTTIPTTDGGQAALSVLAFLQRSKCDALLRVLLSRPGCSFTALVRLLREPRSNIRRKIGALERRNYVNITRKGREMVSVTLIPRIEDLSRHLFKLSEKEKL
jgi:predicted transcriptional regulator